LHKARQEKRKLKRALLAKDHAKPQFDDVERRLVRIATKGGMLSRRTGISWKILLALLNSSLGCYDCVLQTSVVTLFNAVNKAQRQVKLKQQEEKQAQVAKVSNGNIQANVCDVAFLVYLKSALSTV